jgi:hypothetical protein|uniref:PHOSPHATIDYLINOSITOL 4-KINASE BETA n=1 Tax=Myoviridae sp. ct8mY9 TaxID=2827664 RepID=A0A8S5SEC8_9CAUD|nr:MAG TPA: PHOSPHATIDYLINOSITOL 4-KINASE BETA [Myoviridae sp. ct8mY9]
MIEQRIIENEVYTINILQELTNNDKIDLEESIKTLQKHKDSSIIRSSKFIVINTHKTINEINIELINDKIRKLFIVYKTNEKVMYCIEDINIIKEIESSKLDNINKKELMNKIRLIEESIKELEEYLTKLKEKIGENINEKHNTIS